MKLLLAKPRGYCAGVEMAIQCVDKALMFYGSPLYVYHQIVHNKFVVERFEKQGVVFVEDLDEVPDTATLIFSAHGVSPDVRRKAADKQLNVIDATCPLVTKVHAEAKHFIDQGYATFFIGHPGHDETIGIMGEAAGRIELIEPTQEIAEMKTPNTQRIAYLTQTTLSVDDTQQTIDALRERFPAIVGPRKSDICYATQSRQEAVRTLASKADVALIIGSPNSSNSLRLVEVARTRGIPGHLIDGPAEIKLEWFAGVAAILLTAGASVPEEVVASVVSWLTLHFDITIEQAAIKEETVHFQLPVELRLLQKVPNKSIVQWSEHKLDGLSGERDNSLTHQDDRRT